MVSSLSLLPSELPVSVKENPGETIYYYYYYYCYYCCCYYYHHYYCCYCYYNPVQITLDIRRSKPLGRPKATSGTFRNCHEHVLERCEQRVFIECIWCNFFIL